MEPKDIVKIINDCFDPPPEVKAARILHERGVTELEYWNHRNSKEFRLMLDSRRVNVFNALRDIERKT